MYRLRLSLGAQGSTLIQVMVLVAFVASVIAASTAYLHNASSTDMYQRAIASRDSLVNRLQRLATQPGAVRQSLIQALSGPKTDFLKCLLEGPPPPGIPQGAGKCKLSNNPIHFDLYEPFMDDNNNPVKVASGNDWTKPNQRGTLYQLDGKECADTAPAAQCPIEAYSWLVGQCGTYGEPCESYQLVTVHFLVRQRTDLTGGLTMPGGGQVIGQLRPINDQTITNLRVCEDIRSEASCNPPPPAPGDCCDPAATNFGLLLPCQYPTCQDSTAVNYGGPMPCTY